MSVGYAKLELTKGNQMNKTEIEQMGIRELVELVQLKTDLTEIGSFAYALSVAWSFSDSKTKETIVRLIERQS
jgi:hypothetical protein